MDKNSHDEVFARKLFYLILVSVILYVGSVFLFVI